LSRMIKFSLYGFRVQIGPQLCCNSDGLMSSGDEQQVDDEMNYYEINDNVFYYATSYECANAARPTVTVAFVCLQIHSVRGLEPAALQ